MLGIAGRAIADTVRGVTGALRARPGTTAAGAAIVLTLSLLIPPLVLSVVRKPVDYVAFNPWLKRLPAYLGSDVPLRDKLARLPDLALFWCSADSPYGGTDWGFAVDVRDLGRLLLTALLFGLYFALWRRWRERPAGVAVTRLGRSGGVAGALVSVVGLSTGPCSVMGCGAPVLPVVGLAVAGLSSTTVTLLSRLSTAVGVGLIVVLAVAVLALGGAVGRRARVAGL
ncbi:MAG TPA: hypothetical protein VFL90_06575 [Methylomirabilota bacterium]|nr:hypothetical protein [Methylomirabilota bacterium]